MRETWHSLCTESNAYPLSLEIEILTGCYFLFSLFNPKIVVFSSKNPVCTTGFGSGELRLVAL
jgi:hypothetical protein